MALRFSQRMWVLSILVFTVALAPWGHTQSSFPVIPGGVGFGMTTRAAYGCGSTPQILRVTNLNDSGSGSLREALVTTGPRVIIFETSGTIVLDSDIAITAPCLTIAGQTAPSPGITLKGFGLQIMTHDVLMQHLRIRPGDGPPLQPNTWGHDAAIIYRGSTDDVYNVVLDHNSLSWAQGKNSLASSVKEGTGITYWRNFITEGLYKGKHVTFEPAQPSSFGLLLKQSYSGVYANFSVLGNLFAHNSDRNPEIQGPANVHFINNVVYDWGKDSTNYQWATFLYSEGGDLPPRVNIIGNKYIAGPPPSPFTPLVAVGTWGLPTGAKVYLSDNALDNSRQAVTLHQNQGVNPVVGTPPVTLSGITVRPSSSIEAFVLAEAGARPADRDSVDRRIVSEVQSRTGAVISSQDQVGGWPTLAVNRRALTIPASPHAVSSSGYTNLELWLHSYASGIETGSAPTTPTGVHIKAY